MLSSFKEIKNEIPDPIWRRKLLWITFSVSLAAFVTALLLVFVDIFSTALFYDQKLQIALVWDRTLNVFDLMRGALTNTQGRFVSVEGVLVGLALVLGQILLLVRVEQSGSWINGEDVGVWVSFYRFIRKKVDSKKINWNKVGYLLTYVLVVVVDVYTDASWKNGLATPMFSFVGVRNLFLSLMINNFFSEWLIVESSKYVLASSHVLLFKTKIAPPVINMNNQNQSNKNKKRNQNRGKPTGVPIPHNTNGAGSPLPVRLRRKDETVTINTRTQ